MHKVISADQTTWSPLRMLRAERAFVVHTTYMCKYMCMAQLTLYVDDETRRKIESAAKEARLSVSAWVTHTLRATLEHSWPENYFQLLGSLADSDLERPRE